MSSQPGQRQSAVIMDSPNLGGLADSIYSGIPKSLASIVGFDLHNVPGLMLVNQQLKEDSGGVVTDLVKIIPCSDGNMYFIGKTTGKVWEKDGVTNLYSLIGTIPYNTISTYKGGQTTIDDSSIGTIAWTNPNNSQVLDTVYASSVVTTSAVTHFLNLKNFGFAIPATATILGIQVEVDRYVDLGGGVGTVTDSTIKLIKGGTVQGTNLATTLAWTGVEQYYTYGSQSNLWGLALTPTDINASNFGVAISVAGGSGGGGTAYINHVRIKVFYSDSAQVAQILDAREYSGNIYYAQAGYFLGQWTVGSDFSTRLDRFATFANGDTTYHPMEEQNLVLYIGDGLNVAQVDATVTPTSFSATALTLIKDYRVSALGKRNTDLLVGAESTTQRNLAAVFPWNTWSISFNGQIEVPEKGVNAFLVLDTNNIYVSIGTAGNLYLYDWRYQRLIATKQIPPAFPTIYDNLNKGKIYHQAVSNKFGIPIFGFSSIAGNPALQGIYSLGSKNSSYPVILTLELPVSTGLLTNLTIWDIEAVGSDIWVSWSNTTGGNTTYGIDRLDWTTKINGAYFETRVMKYSRTLLDDFSKFVVSYNQNPTGTSVTMYYKINHGTYTAFADTEFINDTKRNEWYSNMDMRAKTMQLKVVVNSVGNNAPMIEDTIVVIK